jgi:hypothetical protein
VGCEFHDGGAVDLVDVGVIAELAEGFKDRSVGPEGPQGAVVLDVVRVFLKRIAELGAFRRFDDDRSFDQAAADSREFGLAMFGTLSGDERIGSDRLPLALSLVPEFEEVAAFGMGPCPRS